MSRSKHSSKKKKGGCLKFILVFLLVIVLALVGTVVYFTSVRR